MKTLIGLILTLALVAGAFVAGAIVDRKHSKGEIIYPWESQSISLSTESQPRSAALIID